MNKTIARMAALALAAATSAGAFAADIVVIGHAGSAPLNKEQLADVYLGKNQSVTPLDQPETAAIRAEFYKKATGRDLAQVKSTWSRLAFTGKGQPPRELPDSAAVKKAVAADPKAIGYVEKSAVDGSVKVVAEVD